MTRTFTLKKAKFTIGQVVKHRLFPFRGVIFDVDPVFDNTDEWWESIPEDIRPHIITWSYPRLHNYYWSNSYINDHSSNKILNINIVENKLNW